MNTVYFRRWMRRIIALILVIAVVIGYAVLMRGSLRPHSDPCWVILKLPNGDIVQGEGQVKDLLTACGVVMITINGIDYQTHFSNVVLCAERP